MKLARVGAPGAEISVLLHNGRHYSLESVRRDLDAQFWETGGPARVRRP